MKVETVEDLDKLFRRRGLLFSLNVEMISFSEREYAIRRIPVDLQGKDYSAMFCDH